MPTNVIILLDKLKNLNCGLGKVSFDFSMALLKESDPEIKITYLLHHLEKWDYLKGQNLKRLHFINRFIPLSFSGNYIFHALHQLPSYSISGSCKKIFTIQDLNFVHVKSKEKALRYLKKVQHNIDRADAIVFVSNFTKDECFKYLHIPENKINKVIYHGVNLPNTLPQRPSCLKEEEDFLFTIGQFLPKKNFHVLIPFMQKTPASTKLVIAGDNNTVYGNYLRRLIVENNLQNRILLVGPVTEAEKLYLYLNCKAFLFPSIAEGFGLPILEAMRAGKPVFCSDKTSLKEIGSKHVFYWDSFDADKMLTIFYAGLNAFNEEKKEEALRYSLQFTWEESVKQHIKLYKLLAES
ncbi:MAG: glycosyltransferase family 4 protein [Chitinispirillaceae bacterium]|nr:glycosyltransferase family 4 protein [Chitinispirillaceae bacterium]